MLGREDPEAAAEAFPLRELLQPVRPAGVGGKDRRHRMPGMALEKARRAVVAGDDEDIGAEGLDAGDHPVEFLDALHLLRERAVLAGGVGVLEVEEEEVVVLPAGGQGVDLLVEGVGRADQRHADEPGEPLVHRVDGDRRRAEPVELLVARELRLGRESAEHHAVGLRLIGEDPPGLDDELLGHLGRPRGGGGVGLRIEGGNARGLRIGVGHGAVEPLAPEDDDEAVFLDRLHERLDTGDLHPLESLDHLEALLGRDPSGAAVADQPG